MDVVGQRLGARARFARKAFLSSMIASVCAAALSGCSAIPGMADSQDRTNDSLNKACAGTALSTRYIVKWKDGTVSGEEAATHEEMVRDLLDPNRSEIEFVERDHFVSLPPQDTFQAEASLAPTNEWGQTIVSAPAVWSAGRYGAGVVVAVVDSGADVSHAQLRNQLAVNSGETGVDAEGRDKAANGIDDDDNGFVDDAYGYDFLNNSPSSFDDNGHGTHVAGIILADHSAGSVLGMAPKAKLLPLGFMDAEGSGTLSAAIGAIKYAARRGAKVINASWGGSYCSQAMRDTIADLDRSGTLFVAAAGNNGDGSQSSGVDIESLPIYPAALGLATQMTVGASTSRDYMTGFSNFSYKLVDLVAPGARIYSLWTGGGTRTIDGTSMATPFVSGAAALLWGFRPKATPAQIKAAILSSVDSGPFSVATRGRLNVKAAVDAIGRTVAP